MPPLNLLNPETPEIVADDRKRAQLSIDDLVYANKIHDRGVIQNRILFRRAGINAE
jgi:hypothetical protein